MDVLIKTEDLQERIKKLGEELSKYYEDKKVDNIICVGILKGSFMFVAELVKHITVPISIDFMTLSSYGYSEKSSGNVKVLLDIRQDIQNKHVLIIEDIIDTETTIKYLLNLLAQRNPDSLTVCSLLKKGSSNLSFNNQCYIGFVIPQDAFVVGFGLDYAEKYRNLPYVAKISL